jgi:hypothetical protein
VHPPADPEPDWWQAIMPLTMRFQPSQPKPLAPAAWQAVAYDREGHRLILRSRKSHRPSYASVALGQPLHRFIPDLVFAPADIRDQSIYLKGVQWCLPAANLEIK